MRKIINNLLYDTDTAEEIFKRETASFGYRDDEPKPTDTIYITKNCNYFALTSGGSNVGPLRIIPMHENAVRDYISRHDVDAYIRIFGGITEA